MLEIDQYGTFDQSIMETKLEYFLRSGNNLNMFEI